MQEGVEMDALLKESWCHIEEERALTIEYIKKQFNIVKKATILGLTILHM